MKVKDLLEGIVFMVFLFAMYVVLMMLVVD